MKPCTVKPPSIWSLRMDGPRSRYRTDYSLLFNFIVLLVPVTKLFVLTAPRLEKWPPMSLKWAWFWKSWSFGRSAKTQPGARGLAKSRASISYLQSGIVWLSEGCISAVRIWRIQLRASIWFAAWLDATRFVAHFGPKSFQAGLTSCLN